MSADGAAALPVIGIAVGPQDEAALQAVLDPLDASGAAIVVVQSAGADVAAADLPARLTARAVETGEVLQAGTVYLLPPGEGADLSGRLLTPGGADDGQPVDRVLTTIARACGPACFGVVLSDTRGDGTRGIAAIREAGGITLSTTDTATADLVVPPGKMAARIAALLDGMPRRAEGPLEGIHALLDILISDEGKDFRGYTPATLSRRIGRRMALHGLTRVADYGRRLTEDDGERAALCRDLLTGATGFFRDAEAWEALVQVAIDPQIEALADGSTLRAWVAGCATGEEAYTLGMLLLERIEASGKTITPQIFATDLSHASITAARRGSYPESGRAGLDADRLARWFEPGTGDRRVVDRLREIVVFAKHDVIGDTPFSSVHLITCRNLMTVLNRDTQSRLLETFHFALHDGGHLMLGDGETTKAAPERYEPRAKAQRIYRRLPAQGAAALRIMERRAGPVDTPERLNRLGADAAVRAMLARFVPPTVLLNDSFEIVSLYGEVGEYLRTPKDANPSDFLSVVAEPFRAQSWYVLQNARRTRGEAKAFYRPFPGSAPAIRITAESLSVKGRDFFLLHFRPESAEAFAAASAGEDTASDEQTAEITRLENQLQLVVEKGEISYEELQTAHEELLSANEAMQIANEELETWRIEMQALNVELANTNNDLVNTVAELEATNDDLSSLINSTDIPTVFLGMDLKIRRFSDRTTSLLWIRAEDVGRPLEDLVLRVEDPALGADMRSVLKNAEPIECEVSGEGRTYLRRVAPHLTGEGTLRGVIVTYADVSHLRAVAKKLEQQAERQASVVALGRLALESEDIGTLFTRACRDLTALLGADRAGVMAHDDGAFTLVAGTGWPRGLVGNTTVPPSPEETELSYACDRNEPVAFSDLETEARFAPSQLLRDVTTRSGICVQLGPVGACWGLLTLFWKDRHPPERDAVLYVSSMASILWLAISQRDAERQRDADRAALQALIDGLPILIAVVGPDLRIDLFNDAWEGIGLTPDETRGAALPDLLGPDVADVCAGLVARAGQSARDDVELEIAVPGQGARTHLIYCVPRLQGGVPGGFFFAAIDIHARKVTEERNRVISAELDHRVKNVLALVDTIARMTGRTANNYDQFRQDFSNRIHSLARTHAHLAAEKWDGMNLRRLILEELEAFSPPGTPRYRVEGPAVSLGPVATQSFALAIHELVTNAAKYGALAVADATLTVTWRVEAGALYLDWAETGTGPLSPPARNGFGTTVLGNALRNQLGGTLDMDFGGDGLKISMKVPMEMLSKGERDV